MKSIKLFCIIIIFTFLFINTNSAQTDNNFVIGIYGADLQFTRSGGKIVTAPKSNGLYTSWLGVIAEDGFNTYVSYHPDMWFSIDEMKDFITLVKNNNLKIIDFNSAFYKAATFSTGINQYNLLNINPSNARYNMFRLYDVVYSDPSILSHIYGHHLGGEYSWVSCWQKKDVIPPGYLELCDEQYGIRAEVPPQNVSNAIKDFSIKRNSLQLNSQKLIFSTAVHGGFTENCTDGIGIFDEEDYVKMTNVSDPQKPDIYIEASYFKDQFREWHKPNSTKPSTIYPNPKRYYLGKFKSIDFAKKYFKNVLSEIDFEQTSVDPDLIYDMHSNPLIPNGNQLWFQTYTSIIHGASGIIFYHINAGYKEYEILDTLNRYYVNHTSNPDRFMRGFFPQLYQAFVSNLSKELRYLKNNNFLSDNPNSIIYTKTTDTDINGILVSASSSGSYLPNYILNKDLRDWYFVNNNTTYNPNGVKKNPHRTEDYGIRYTIRTNGTEVIMIASNPNPYTIHNVGFNFTNVANPIIRSATAVDVLFDDNNIADVNDSNYKTTRSNSVDLQNNTLLKKHRKSLVNHAFAVDFGPFDVRIFKFVSSPPVYNNKWEKVWTNHGSGNIGEWGPVANFHTYIPTDVDGDGAQELLCIQNQSNNYSWVSILKYSNSSWNVLWSNKGNGLIGTDWTLSPNDKFYVGDFNNDTRDELLIFSGLNSYVNMYSFYNGKYNWYWSNGGSSNFADAWPRNDARYFVGDFDGDNQKEIISFSLVNTWSAMFKFFNNKWNWIWSNGGSSNFADAWPVKNSYNYYVGNFDGNATDDLFSISGENNWVIYLYYANNKWNWGGSNDGNNSIASWYLPYLSTDKILTGKIDNDALSELMFIQSGASASKAQSADYSGCSLTRRWCSCDAGLPYIYDWPIADGIGNNTQYYLIKATVNEPSYLLAMRCFGGQNVYLVNMYKSTSGTLKSTNDSNNELDNFGTYANSDIKLYPNPNSGYFMIQLNNHKEGSVLLEIFNNLGQHIYSKNLVYQGKNDLYIDSKLPPGLYYYSITNNKERQSGKLVIE